MYDVKLKVQGLGSSRVYRFYFLQGQGNLSVRLSMCINEVIWECYS